MLRKFAAIIVTSGALFSAACEVEHNQEYYQECGNEMPPGWNLVWWGSDGSLACMYEDSIKQDGNLVEVWNVLVYPEPTTKLEEVGFPLVGTFRYLTKIDCDQRKTKVLDLTLYTGPWMSGEFQSLPIKNEWQHIGPNSAYETLYRLLCN
jgi:hypothetical protein